MGKTGLKTDCPAEHCFFFSVWPGQYIIFTNNYEAKIFNLYNEMIPVKSADEAYLGIFKSVQNSCFSMPLVR